MAFFQRNSDRYNVTFATVCRFCLMHSILFISFPLLTATYKKDDGSISIGELEFIFTITLFSCVIFTFIAVSICVHTINNLKLSGKQRSILTFFCIAFIDIVLYILTNGAYFGFARDISPLYIGEVSGCLLLSALISSLL